MPIPRTVAVIVGSLRQASLTLKAAKALGALAPEHLKFRFIRIDDLPLYNEEHESDPPETWRRFRREVAECEAVLFATPEYNRSIPAPLKNAIDVGSRPMKASVWKAKPAAIVSVSPGQLSGFGANHHLRQCLVFLDMPTLQAPEAYIGKADTLFDEGGQVKSEETKAFLRSVMTAFADWIERTAQPPLSRASAA